MNFHHVGVAVHSIEKELKHYRELGATEISQTYSDKNLKVSVCFLNFNGLQIELVEPNGSPSPIDNYLKKKIRMYHQCFEVNSLIESIEELSKQRAMMIVPPTPAIAFQNRKVAFFMFPNGDIIELVESI